MREVHGERLKPGSLSQEGSREVSRKRDVPPCDGDFVDRLPVFWYCVLPGLTDNDPAGTQCLREEVSQSLCRGCILVTIKKKRNLTAE